MFVIIGTHDFYGPTTREIEVDEIITDNDGNDRRINTFATREAAEAYITDLDSDRYYLKHNESNRPSYRVEPAGYMCSAE